MGMFLYTFNFLLRICVFLPTKIHLTSLIFSFYLYFPLVR